MSSDSLFPTDESPHAHHLALVRHARRLDTALQVDIARERRITALEAGLHDQEENMQEHVKEMTKAITELQLTIAKSGATTRLLVVLCTAVLGPLLVLVAQKALGLH